MESIGCLTKLANNKSLEVTTGTYIVMTSLINDVKYIPSLKCLIIQKNKTTNVMHNKCDGSKMNNSDCV